MPTLNERMEVYSTDNMLFEMPEIISSSISQSMEIRPYQREAFRRFITYFEKTEIKRYPAQVLFHMATGSGKTLIMAGLIAYLYKQGYSNFVFFVNSTNIIEKTKQNFLESTSSKYLFADTIMVDGHAVPVKEVQNFSSTDEKAINILFTTTSKLHRDMNPLLVRENAPTIDDFENKKIVLISDESHHLNVDTRAGKKLTNEEMEEKESWETTVTRIFNANRENVLLEFTATCDTENEFIKAKYNDKLIYDYPLKNFRIDKYSKEVKVFQSDTENFDRSLLAILLSQYRLKLFQKYGLRIKPVVMFKSKTINESKSFYEEFQSKLAALTGVDIEKLLTNGNVNNEPVVVKMTEFFSSTGVNYDALADEIKMDFNEEHCVVVNNKEESEEKQIAVNTLEDETNIYRLVFAVDKLNEGWDVLNLFDIVRLYDTRDAKGNTVGKTTISEAQLIGRGARYCPFIVDEMQDKFKRKYDDDLENEMRVCEELYYHSKYNPKYIQELGVALRESGIWSTDTRKPIALRLKKDFLQSELYKNGLIFINERLKKERSNINALPDSALTRVYTVNLPTGYIKTSIAFETVTNERRTLKDKRYSLIQMGKAAISKAMRGIALYEFRNLQSFLPNVKSTTEFIKSESYLGGLKISVRGIEEDVDNLSPENKLFICKKVLNELVPVISSIKMEYEGTEIFVPKAIKETFKNKIINIADIKEEGVGTPQSSLTGRLYLNLPSLDWYAFEDNYGTTEEKELTIFMSPLIEDLKKRYQSVTLLRNEQFFKLYSFNDGQAFEPDFILFLQEKAGSEIIQYQVFIEPKGTNLIENDKWKETFLLQMKDKAKAKEILWENYEFRIIGLPFFNHEVRLKEFENAISELK